MTDDATMSATPDGKQTILTEKRGAIYVVTINRPDVRNALDAPTAAALAQAFRAFDSDESLAVAVLSGGNTTFCSGFDLKSVADGTRPPEVDAEGDGPMGVTRMLLSKPVIAAVEGYAVAGGLEVALWCDLRVAAENAVFGVFNRRWGVPLIDGGTIRLPRLIGQSHALDLILTGRGVSGQEALTMGLANRLTQPGAALATALSLADDLARFPQQGLRSDRLSVYEQWSLAWPEALRNETRRGLDTLRSGESVEGARRFADGRGRHGAADDI
ncbi:MAG: crotonase/enoyl-CoA hydratase family protein [Ktedonobacterales bacterium]